MLALTAGTAAARLEPALKPALRLRGGSVLTNVGATLFGASGALAWIAPGKNLEQYGLSPADPSALNIMRGVGAWQLCASAVLLAGKQGATYASGFGLFAAGLSQLAVLPTWEYFEREKPSQVGAVALFAALGKYTLDGAVSPYVGAAVYLLVGSLIHFMPKGTAELYQVTKPITPLGYSMLSLYGGTILTTGAYLGALAYGLAQPQALAASFVTNGVLALKWALTEAEGLGAPKAGPLAWAAASLAIVAAALK